MSELVLHLEVIGFVLFVCVTPIGMAITLAFWWFSRRRAPSAEHMNWKQLLNYGKDLGIEPRRLESYDSFRHRVVTHLRSAPWRDVTTNTTINVGESWED